MQNLHQINTLITFLSPLQKEQVKTQSCCKNKQPDFTAFVPPPSWWGGASLLLDGLTWTESQTEPLDGGVENHLFSGLFEPQPTGWSLENANTD